MLFGLVLQAFLVLFGLLKTKDVHTPSEVCIAALSIPARGRRWIGPGLQWMSAHEKLGVNWGCCHTSGNTFPWMPRGDLTPCICIQNVLKLFDAVFQKQPGMSESTGVRSIKCGLRTVHFVCIWQQLARAPDKIWLVFMEIDAAYFCLPCKTCLDQVLAWSFQKSHCFSICHFWRG